MINRRSLLKSVLALPILGPLLGRATEAVPQKVVHIWFPGETEPVKFEEDRLNVVTLTKEEWLEMDEWIYPSARKRLSNMAALNLKPYKERT